eukprot:scaffold22046_cov20-Prasinocladus_malaysianus.AAC.1
MGRGTYPLCAEDYVCATALPALQVWPLPPTHPWLNGAGSFNYVPGCFGFCKPSNLKRCQ